MSECITPRQLIREQILKLLCENHASYRDELIKHLELVSPPSYDIGDYATSLPFQMAKFQKKPPFIIAQEFSQLLSPRLPPAIDKITATKPGYINFTISKTWLHAALGHYGRDGMAAAQKQKTLKKVLVEYSSPNIAKMMHVGHFRSTLIGHALDNLFRHLGYQVVNDNHLGDWGTQFGKLLVAYRLWHTTTDDSTITVPELEELYIRFHREVKENRSFDDLARAETVKLQQGDSDARRIWEQFCAISIAEFTRIYTLFGISFDYLHGESFYEPMLPGIVKEALETRVAIESQGAVIIPLDDAGLPPYMIRKSDGGFLYSTSDLATIKWRDEQVRPDLVLYVVGDQQALHFKQLFAAARKLGYGSRTELVHVPFGLILGEHGRKMSTREGEAVDATHFINKAIDLAKKIINEKKSSLSPAERDTAAQRVALSALVYNDLSRDRESSVTFNWDTMMNFRGSSAPYLLYTYVRIQSIVRKVLTEFPDDQRASADATLLNERDELLLMRKVVKFPEACDDVAHNYRPHQLVNYLEELANIFHTAYDRLPVAHADEPIRRARLLLFHTVAATMKKGMEILGMQPVEKM